MTKKPLVHTSQTPYTSLKHTPSPPGPTYCKEASDSLLFTHVHTHTTRWSSKYTSMCVSKIAAWLLYLFITHGHKHTHTHTHMLTHTYTRVAKTISGIISAADHRSKLTECDNAFTPQYTHIHSTHMIPFADSSIKQWSQAAGVVFDSRQYGVFTLLM